MIIIKKTLEELNEKSFKRLEEEGINSSPGSIARLFLSIINEDFSEAYESLQTYHVQHLLSTSEGEYVDHIGAILNCTRRPEESDGDYKYRISKQTLSLEKANETALRLSILAVEGVQDVVLQPYSHGPGTFSALLILDPDVQDSILIKAKVEASLKNTAAYGTKFHIYEPIPKFIKLKLKLHTEPLSTSDFTDLIFLLKNELTQFLNGQKIGEEFNAQELTKIVLNADKRIKRFSALSFSLNDEESDFRITPCRWNERFVLSSEPDALTLL